MVRREQDAAFPVPEAGGQWYEVRSLCRAGVSFHPDFYGVTFGCVLRAFKDGPVSLQFTDFEIPVRQGAATVDAGASRQPVAQGGVENVRFEAVPVPAAGSAEVQVPGEGTPDNF